MGGGRLAFLSLLRKWRLCWAFFTVEQVFRDQVNFSARWTSRNFVFITISTGEPWMFSGSWSLCAFRKSTTISLVLSIFRDRLLTLHQVISCSTSSLYDDSSFLLMRPTTVVSSANLMMWFESWSAMQSWVRSANSSGLISQPWGAPVLSMVVREVLFPIRTVWGLAIRKSISQVTKANSNCSLPHISNMCSNGNFLAAATMSQAMSFPTGYFMLSRSSPKVILIAYRPPIRATCSASAYTSAFVLFSVSYNCLILVMTGLAVAAYKFCKRMQSVIRPQLSSRPAVHCNSCCDWFGYLSLVELLSFRLNAFSGLTSLVANAIISIRCWADIQVYCYVFSI